MTDIPKLDENTRLSYAREHARQLADTMTLARFDEARRDFWLAEANDSLTDVAAHLGYDLVKSNE